MSVLEQKNRFFFQEDTEAAIPLWDAAYYVYGNISALCNTIEESQSGQSAWD